MQARRSSDVGSVCLSSCLSKKEALTCAVVNILSMTQVIYDFLGITVFLDARKVIFLNIQYQDKHALKHSNIKPTCSYKNFLINPKLLTNNVYEVSTLLMSINVWYGGEHGQ